MGGSAPVGAGAAFDLAMLLAEVDGFWESGLKPWDVAAGALRIGVGGIFRHEASENYHHPQYCHR